MDDFFFDIFIFGVKGIGAVDKVILFLQAYQKHNAFLTVLYKYVTLFGNCECFF